MLTLSYGFFKPETGDRGSVWFPNLETNFQKLNDHTHNGVESALLAPASITKYTTSIAAASFTGSNGVYSNTVTVPAGITEINTYLMVCKINTAGAQYGDEIHPTMERVSATTFTLTINTNTLDVIIYYI
jgi:hypothetical protein